MADYDHLEIVKKYIKNSLEIEKLEKELKQKKTIKSKLLYSLSKIEEDSKLKFEEIRKLNSFCYNANNKELQELWNMLNEESKTTGKSTSLRQQIDNAKGEKQTPKEKEDKEESVDEKEKKEELEKRKGISNNKEFKEKEEETKDASFTNKKRNRTHSY